MGVSAERRLKDRYVLVRLPIAHSGLGEVWRAHDDVLDRDVIVKFISPGAVSLDLLRRFVREARLTAGLEHPGVPAVFDFGDDEGSPYLVLQRIGGVTLSDLTDEHGPLPVPWVAAIGAQISSVLMAAQEIGLVHRDLKPSNVMLEPSGAVKVLDFGVAVIRDDPRYSRITHTGESLGTVGYMAPEQIHGKQPDHRSDLYGLGGTLFHLLTGTPPFDDDTTSATLENQLVNPPPRPSHRRSDVPEALDDLVHALLAERPEDRPASAADVYIALAPHVTALPPMPGFVPDGLNPVRAYAAAISAQPGGTVSPNRLRREAEFDPDHAAEQAGRHTRAREFRAAARLWRQIAGHYEGEHGPDHPLTLDSKLHVADAHLSLGEHSRAARLVDEVEVHAGAEHPRIQQIRRDIDRSTAQH